MKKWILYILCWIFLLGFGFATYVPTAADTADIKNLKTQLETLIDWNNVDLWSFYNQTTNLKSQYSKDERLNYMLWELESYLYTNLANLKWASKITSKSAKRDFLNQYNTWFDSWITYTVDQCVLRYNTLDNLSFAYDFPTAVTLAVWYRESNCGYYLPSNGNGPFQITSKDYGTGSLTQSGFIQAVEDFLVFAKNKWKKSPSWNLSYSNYDYTGIVNFAALYNGWKISWDMVIPYASWYVFDWYGDDFSWAKRFGILPQTLKILERELENKY